jgi:hypothetical protein
MNSVLDGHPTYIMGAILLLVGVRESLDARRRAFLWNGTDKASGAQCLVAWEKVCATKEDGGLSIKRLDTQNACLLLKLILRLHHLGKSSWAAWTLQHTRLSNLRGGLEGPHWDALHELPPAYRSIYWVDVGDGASMSFWHDLWADGLPLSVKYPALFSHFTGREDSVKRWSSLGSPTSCSRRRIGRTGGNAPGCCSDN